MNTILKFPLERVQRRSYGNPDPNHDADILLFEGVQYVMPENKKRAVNQKKSGKRKASVKS